MDKFYLEEPGIKRKQEALDYLQEFIDFNSEIYGCGALDNCLNDLTYEEFLIENEKRKDLNYAYSINRCPSLTFFLIRQSDNKIIGTTNVRYSITPEFLKLGASHIGYSIRPTERNKGYNKIQLFLALLEEQKIGEKEIVLNCDEDNIASNKSILALGGKLNKKELDPNDNTMTNYYRIIVDDSIRDNYSKYNDVIIK